MTNLLVFAAVFGTCGFGIVIFFVFRIMVSPKKLHHIESLIANGNVKSAIRQAKTLLSRNERNADAHFWLGECYRAEKRPDLAVTNTSPAREAIQHRRRSAGSASVLPRNI
jgi:thioredoxin-like negative regulator of GroEL